MNADAVASELPYLRRFARALAGNQKSGDAYVAATLEALVADPDEYTRMNAIRAAQRLAQRHPEASIRLLNRVSFADSARVADEVFQILGPHGDLRADQLPTAIIDRLLSELEACPSIEGYWVEAFLAEVAATEAELRGRK